MIPDPVIGKHYKLQHKSSGTNPFRGYVLIANVGFINGQKIFLTNQRGRNWFLWKDYNYEYIGDIA